MEPLKPPSGGIRGVLKAAWMCVLVMSNATFWGALEFLTPHKKFNIKKAPKRPGEIVLITGGGRGIGKEVVKKLLMLHMHIIMGVRNKTATKAMMEELRGSDINTGSVDILNLNLKSLESVREFATQVSQKYPKIHILINNAGIYYPPYELSEERIEMTVQVNYLGHFLLTQMLLPSLGAAGTIDKPSRIVHLSSICHYTGKLDLNDLWLEKAYEVNWAYSNSKLMQAIFSRDLNDRLVKNGYPIRSYSLHPGCISTGLFHALNKRFLCCLRIFLLSPEKGADCVLYVALSPDIEQHAGKYFQYCKPYPTNSQVKKREVQEALWEASCEITGWHNFTCKTPSTDKHLPVISITKEMSPPPQSSQRSLERNQPTMKKMNKIEVEVKHEIFKVQLEPPTRTSTGLISIPTKVGGSE